MRMGNIPMLSKSITFDVLPDWKSNIKKFDIMPGTACISQEFDGNSGVKKFKSMSNWLSS